tara:strand:- start:19535 stop:19903 length:369 start_codon:yes stop_codon:yes gene_type:complete
MVLDMYAENILDLYKNPLNKGVLEFPTHEFERENPFCGDEIKIQLIIKGNKISDIKFNGKGCVISIASASLLTNKVKDMDLDSIKKLSKEDILGMLNIPISLGRMGCVLLSLETLRGAIKND